MVRDDLCYQNLPVTVVGMGAGVIYSTLGGTHHAQEDIAIAGAHPEHADHRAVRSGRMHRGDALVRARRRTGPVYLRLGKAGEPVLHQGRRALAIRQDALSAARHRRLHPHLRRHHEDGGGVADRSAGAGQVGLARLGATR